MRDSKEEACVALAALIESEPTGAFSLPFDDSPPKRFIIYGGHVWDEADIVTDDAMAAVMASGRLVRYEDVVAGCISGTDILTDDAIREAWKVLGGTP